MSSAKLRDRVATALHRTAEKTATRGKSAVRIFNLELDLIHRYGRKSHAESDVKLAMAVYVADQDIGNELVAASKERQGLLVIADSDLLLTRDLSWGRSHTAAYPLSGFTAEPIQFSLKRKEAEPGLKLGATDGDHFLAFGLWPAGRGSPDRKREVRDQAIGLINEAGSG